MPSLTSHLLSLDLSALTAATTHPFLPAAATSRLHLSELKAWLAQDRLYALSYTNFIGSLLASLSVPSTSMRASTIEWRTADLLIDSLINIRREMQLFEDTAKIEGYLEEICAAEPEVQTRAYQDLFAGATARGRGSLVGLTVLWATEECYLRAWRFAREAITGEGEGDVMQRVFIPNWSSDEFAEFVARIGGLVDEWGKHCTERERRECEVAWRQVLWAEKNFWPDV